MATLQSAADAAECKCFRHDSGDPLGMIPSSVKLDQLEREHAVLLFTHWWGLNSPSFAVVQKVRDEMCEAWKMTPTDFALIEVKLRTIMNRFADRASAV